MDFLPLMTETILLPAPLFFLLGVMAGFFKSDLEIPDSISSYLSIYLMMSIGFKGGVKMAEMGAGNTQMLWVILAGVGLSYALPYLAYFLLDRTTKLDKVTAAALGAHYGSISMVTFATAVSFVKAHDIPYAGYIVAVLALMEAPAIIAGLHIAHRAAPETRKHAPEEHRLFTRDIFTNGAILLLLGSFVIGWISGDAGMSKMRAFLVDPFQGILALFLLDMGLLVAKKLHHIRQFTASLLLFGLYMPLLGAGFGLGSAWLIGLDVGTATLFTVLCASASYIAVPAAMRLALPEADASIYIPLSLGITFPFNVALGIPLYYTLANLLLR
jgi:hypothetical protein